MSERHPMRVVVTGGSGLAGRAVVADLVDHGFDVTNVDLVPRDGPAPFRRVTIEDLGQVYGGLRGAEAVVHFAAIPRPTFDVPEVVFRTNVMGSFNVLEAAATLGIRRVVMASSVSVLGFPAAPRGPLPAPRARRPGNRFPAAGAARAARWRRWARPAAPPPRALPTRLW